MTTPERLESFAATYREAWNNHDLEAIARHHTDDTTYHLHTSGGTIVVGKTVALESFAATFALFPDLRFEPTRLIIASEHIVAESAITATIGGQTQTADVIDVWSVNEQCLMTAKDTYLDGTFLIDALATINA